LEKSEKSSEKENPQKMKKNNRRKLAELLKRKIREKPWDDYILIEKGLLWKIIEELEK